MHKYIQKYISMVIFFTCLMIHYAQASCSQRNDFENRRLTDAVQMAYQKACSMGIKGEPYSFNEIIKFCNQPGYNFCLPEVRYFLAGHDSPLLEDILNQGYQEGKNYAKNKRNNSRLK